MSTQLNQAQLGVNGVTDPNSLARLRTISDRHERAEAVATQLESVFWGMMIKSMRAAVPEGELMGKGLGGREYVDMLDQQLAQLQGLPRDPRFHGQLVKQILDTPEAVDAALDKINGKDGPITPEV